MIGKVGIAPCGHPGEHIVSTFVICLEGCDSKDGPKRKGLSGHERKCVCQPCRMRKYAVKIVLKDVNGKELFACRWDGKDVPIVGVSPGWTIESWHAYNHAGEPVASGEIMANINQGAFEFRPLNLT